MVEILWHGRGGQGAFTAARLLGTAYVKRNENSYALVFPSFGPERRGAPIRAFTKLDDRPIGDRSEIYRADFSIFLDDTLFSPESLSELKPDGRILLNTKKPVEHPQVITIDADAIAEEILHIPMVNTTMLGTFIGCYDGIDFTEIEEAIREQMAPKIQGKNIAVVHAAAAVFGREADR